MEKSENLESWFLRNICLGNKVQENCEFSTINISLTLTLDRECIDLFGKYVTTT